MNSVNWECTFAYLGYFSHGEKRSLESIETITSPPDSETPPFLPPCLPFPSSVLLQGGFGPSAPEETCDNTKVQYVQESHP